MTGNTLPPSICYRLRYVGSPPLPTISDAKRAPAPTKPRATLQQAPPVMNRSPIKFMLLLGTRGPAGCGLRLCSRAAVSMELRRRLHGEDHHRSVDRVRLPFRTARRREPGVKRSEEQANVINPHQTSGRYTSSTHCHSVAESFACWRCSFHLQCCNLLLSFQRACRTHPGSISASSSSAAERHIP